MDQGAPPRSRPSETRGDLAYSFVMDRLSKLREELAYLEQRLPELEERPELDRLVSEFKKQMAAIRHEILSLEGDK